MTNPAFTHSVTPENLFDLRFLQSAQLAPTDHWVCAVISEYDAAQDADIHHLWLYSLSGEPPRQLTQHNGVNSNPTWSPDGTQIAFTSDRGDDGKPQIYVMPVDGGEARQLTNLPQGVTGTLAWSPDGESIAFGTGREENADLDPSDPYRVTRHIYRFDAIGYLDQQIHDIYMLVVQTGAVKQLTDDERHNTTPQWSPDSSRLLYSAMLPTDVHGGIFPQLHVVDRDGNVVVVVGAEWGETTGSAAWMPDGQSIVFAGTPAGLPIGSKSDLYVVNCSDKNGSGKNDGNKNDGAPVNYSADSLTGIGGGLQADMPTTLLRQPAQLLVTRDGRFVYGRIQNGGALHIARFMLDLPEHKDIMLDGERCVVPLGLTSDEQRLVYAVSDVNAPWDLYVVDLTGGAETRLSNINGETLASFAKIQTHHLRYPSKDGVEVEGWLFHPESAGSQGDGTQGKGGPFPTVLYIHGGPHSAFGHIYHCDTQMLLGAGFAVLMINHRASTGYGDSFSTAIKGDWGNLDYADLMAGVDAAIEAGLTDGDRLGVCGLSGGGNLSCWIVGQTERFKAAVPENPLTNWSSFYGVSDIGVWFGVEQLGGHLHEIPETYIRCSPITYAHSCTTPTLLVQCESDWRCPAEQSEQFYNVLKANGCPVEMLRLPGGSHGGCVTGLPKLRRAQNEALLGWMERYV